MYIDFPGSKGFQFKFVYNTHEYEWSGWMGKAHSLDLTCLRTLENVTSYVCVFLLVSPVSCHIWPQPHSTRSSFLFGVFFPFWWYSGTFPCCRRPSEEGQSPFPRLSWMLPRVSSLRDSWWCILWRLGRKLGWYWDAIYHLKLKGAESWERKIFYLRKGVSQIIRPRKTLKFNSSPFTPLWAK